MKSFRETFLSIFRKDKGIIRWMIVNFLVGLFVFVFSIFQLNPDSAVVKIGYGDIGGYKDGSWTDMIVFPIFAFVVGVLHSMIAVRIFEKKGAGTAKVFLVVSFLILIGIFVVLIRLLGEG